MDNSYILFFSDPPQTGKRPRRDSTGSGGEPIGTRVMAITNGQVPCNKHLCDLVKIVKPHIRQLVEDTNLVMHSISFVFYIKKHF